VRCPMTEYDLPEEPHVDANVFFTIGHSTRSVEELAHLLQEAGCTLLVDVRTVPRSRTNPQFNLDAMPASLTPFGIDYRHLASLGGLRGRPKGGGPSPNGFWENASFRNYADYTASDTFREGLAELRRLGEAQRCAIMCAEAVWWRCHRRLIADYLIAEGLQVLHIMGAGKHEPARLNPAARRQPDGTLVYPPEPSEGTGSPEGRSAKGCACGGGSPDARSRKSGSSED
jgi:hypothetical protein